LQRRIVHGRSEREAAPSRQPRRDAVTLRMAKVRREFDEPFLAAALVSGL